MHPGYQPKTVLWEYKHGQLLTQGDAAKDQSTSILVQQHTLASARAFCEDDAYCVGYTFQATSAKAKGAVMMTFKNSADFKGEVFKAAQGVATWHSYLKKHMIPHEHEYHAGEQVSTQLGAANFASFVHSAELALVNYYAPWCIWCQRLSPVWEQYAAVIEGKHYEDVVKLGKVDCTSKDGEAICAQGGVHAYPTISLFRNGQTDSHMFYHGERSVAAFTEVVDDLMKDWVRGCNWRNTADCTPNGKRESTNDRHCGAEVPSGTSGFCECVDRRITAKSTCEHAPFSCKAKCAELKDGDPGQTYDWHKASARDFAPDSHGCAQWRSTGGCSAHGPREPEHDKPCDAVIGQGLSGYCECVRKGGEPKGGAEHKNHNFEVGCDHAPFTCDEACEAPDFEKFLSEHKPSADDTADGRRLSAEAFRLQLLGAGTAAQLAAAQRLQHRAGGSEGCLVAGTLHVKKVPGKVLFRAHSAPAEGGEGGAKAKGGGGHSFDADKLDMSHVVKHFTFGKESLTRLTDIQMRRRLAKMRPHGVSRHAARVNRFGRLDLLDRLAGRTFESDAKKTTHQHYLKVIGTNYKFADETPSLQAFKCVLPLARRPRAPLAVPLRADDVNAQAHNSLSTCRPCPPHSRYTATSHQHAEEFGDMPSVKFAYNLDPMSLEEKEEFRPTYHFVTQLCAILGGFFTVLGIFDSLVFYLRKQLEKEGYAYDE